MKSIKEYQDIKNKPSLQNIIGQSLWYTRNCILSVSLMSGFGLPWNYDQVRVDEWLSTLNNKEDNSFIPENLVLLRAVYKKGDPQYCNAYNGNRNDFQNFLWEESSFKKTITPASQAYLIMNEIMLAKYMYECGRSSTEYTRGTTEKKATSLLLLKSALLQADFLSHHLRNKNGFFISKTDKSKTPFGEPELKEDDNSPNISDQALALEAFSMLSNVLNDDAYPLFKDSELSSASNKSAKEIYAMFQDSYDDVFNCKTKELCNIISSCIEFYRLHLDDSDILDYITMLSLELESRVDMSGNLIRFSDENSLTSNSSSFIALKTLIKSYAATDIYKFQNCASILYKKLNLLWNQTNSLYLLDDDDKFKYTLRDVGSVIGGLNSMRLFAETEYQHDAEEKLVSFFNAAVNSSGIVQSSIPPPSIDDCEGYFNCIRNNCDTLVYENFCSQDIPHSIESSVAPVFAKKFTFKAKKHKYDINSTSFYSDYALYTVNEMLSMSHPLIDCFYCKKKQSSLKEITTDF